MHKNRHEVENSTHNNQHRECVWMAKFDIFIVSSFVNSWCFLYNTSCPLTPELLSSQQLFIKYEQWFCPTTTTFFQNSFSSLNSHFCYPKIPQKVMNYETLCSQFVLCHPIVASSLFIAIWSLNNIVLCCLGFITVRWVGNLPVASLHDTNHHVCGCYLLWVIERCARHQNFIPGV